MLYASTCFCKKCGILLANNIVRQKCSICGGELQNTNTDTNFFDIPRNNEAEEAFVLQFQPKEQFDQMAWQHRHNVREGWYIKKAWDDHFNFKYNPDVINVECPYCHQFWTTKIGAGSRLLSTGLFGLGSKKLGKQWHCYFCNSDF